MMDRAEKTGFGVALAGHAALLAVLSLGWASVRQPPILNEPMEVSFVEDVAIRSAAPSTEAPAPSVAPELGAPEEPAPVAEPAPPEPTPPPPEPEPIPPPPQPRPVPKAVVRPAPKPVAKPAPARPVEKAKAAPAKATPAKTAAKGPPAKAAASAATKGKAPAARGSVLGKDFLKGIGSDPAPKSAPAASGAVMSPIALAGIKSAIQRQIQPCADRQVDPGPGANRIQVTLNLRLNPDGSLAQRPSVVRTTGVDDANSRYEQQVTDRAIATYTGCAPLRGLPDELYRTAKGGWSNINMNYKLPG